MGSPVSPIVADIFMEFLEQSAIASVPVECKLKLWKRYVDDILEIIKKHRVDGPVSYTHLTLPTNREV